MSRSLLLTSAHKHWQLTVAFAIWVCEMMFAMTLFGRWLTGAFEAEPMFWFGACVTIMLSSAACIARLFAHQNRTVCSCCSISETTSTIIADLLTIIPPVVSGFALLSMSSAMPMLFLVTLTLLLCVGTFFAAESSHQNCFHWLNMMMWGEAAIVSKNEPAQNETPATMNLSLEERLLQQADTVETNGSDKANSGQIQQSITRQTTDEGYEVISGTVQVIVEAGAKQAYVHIPFSPPLKSNSEANPEVTCELETDFPARVTPSAIHTYGTRLELRLTEPAEEETTLDINFTATAN